MASPTPDIAPADDTGRGCLLHVAGPACLVLGTVWTLVGLAGYLSLLTGGYSLTERGAFVMSAAGVVALVVGWRLTRPLLRRSGRRMPGENAPATYHGLALRGGKSANGRVEGDVLVLETFEVRPVVVAVGAALMLVFFLTFVVVAWRGGALPSLPWHVFLIPIAPFSTRRVLRRYPLDAFGAIETREKTVRLHRRGAGRPPLELALKTWQLGKFVAELRTRRPDAFEATPPPDPPERRDEAEELREELAAWVPEGRGAAATLGGIVLVAAALLLGGFRRLGTLELADVLARAAAGGAVLLWLQDRATRAFREREARRVDASPTPLVVETRRDGRDLLGWMAPWRRTEVLADDGRLTLLHRPVEGFDVVVMLGVACLTSWLLIGSFTPWWAAACFVTLLASGYPRRRRDAETYLPEHVVALDDEGSRAKLRVRDEDGPREILLRFQSGNGPRFTGCIKELCPAARVREPGWRTGG